MKEITVYEAVKRIIGQINPIGETTADNARFGNLKEMCILVNKLMSDIDDVARYNKDREEFSMKRAGEYAQEFLKEILCVP